MVGPMGPAPGRSAREAVRRVPVSLDADPKGVWFAVFAPDGLTLASGGDGGILKLWDVASRQQRSASEVSNDLFRCAAFSPDGKTLATGRLSGALTLWDASSGKPLKNLKEHSSWIYSVGFSPDGTLLVTSGQDRKVAVWETATWRVVRIARRPAATGYRVADLARRQASGRGPGRPQAGGSRGRRRSAAL